MVEIRDDMVEQTIFCANSNSKIAEVGDDSAKDKTECYTQTTGERWIGTIKFGIEESTANML